MTRGIYLDVTIQSKSNSVSSAERYGDLPLLGVPCGRNIHRTMSYEQQRTICHGYYYLTRLILPRDLALFLSFPLSPSLLILRFVTPTRSSGHVRSVRALSFGFQSRESSWRIRSASRMDLGHSVGSDLLNWPRAGTAHTPAAHAPKSKKNFFQPANRPGRVSARQSACNLRPTRWV